MMQYELQLARSLEIFFRKKQLEYNSFFLFKIEKSSFIDVNSVIYGLMNFELNICSTVFIIQNSLKNETIIIMVLKALNSEIIHFNFQTILMQYSLKCKNFSVLCLKKVQHILTKFLVKGNPDMTVVMYSPEYCMEQGDIVDAILHHDEYRSRIKIKTFKRAEWIKNFNIVSVKSSLDNILNIIRLDLAVNGLKIFDSCIFKKTVGSDSTYNIFLSIRQYLQILSYRVAELGIKVPFIMQNFAETFDDIISKNDIFNISITDFSSYTLSNYNKKAIEFIDGYFLLDENRFEKKGGNLINSYYFFPIAYNNKIRFDNWFSVIFDNEIKVLYDNSESFIKIKSYIVKHIPENLTKEYFFVDLIHIYFVVEKNSGFVLKNNLRIIICNLSSYIGEINIEDYKELLVYAVMHQKDFSLKKAIAE